MESGIGSLIAFSTQPGNVALDGIGRNSPFAGALIKHMPRPGQDLSSILIAVRNEVMTVTRNRQVPWEHSALRARFYFVDQQAPTGQERDAEQLLWSVAADSKTLALLSIYLERYPNGANIARALAMMEQIRAEEAAQMVLLQRETAVRRRRGGQGARRTAKSSRTRARRGGRTPSGARGGAGGAGGRASRKRRAGAPR